MGGRHSRTKGAAYEREVARLVREAMPGATVRRGLQARGGREVPDVDCPHFHLETKRGKLPSPRRALEQAKRDVEASGSGKVPVAVIRDDRAPAFVVMTLDDWLVMLGEWWASRQDADCSAVKGAPARFQSADGCQAIGEANGPHRAASCEGEGTDNCASSAHGGESHAG